MEAPLYGLCLAGLLYVLLRLGPALRHPSSPAWMPAVIGLAVGATMLAAPTR